MPIEINGTDDRKYADLKNIKARAIFRVMSPPLRAKTADGYIEKPQASNSFLATYTRLKLDGSHETVQYYKSKTLRPGPHGTQITQYEPMFVMIEGGEMNLSTVTDKDLYWFLVNHPHNKSNPVYDKEADGANAQRIDELLANRNVPFNFYEVDGKRNAKKNLANERLLEAAKKMVLAEKGQEGYLDNKQVVLLCRAYSMHETDDCIMVDDYDTLRNALLDQVKVDPAEFMKKVESAALGIEAMVADAIRLTIINYDQPEAADGGWYWGATSKPIEPKKICVVPSEKYSQRETLLVDFLRTDAAGVSISKRMKDEVESARKQKLASK